MGRAATHFARHFKDGRLQHRLSSVSRAFVRRKRRLARRFSMPSLTEWKVPPANQPRPGDYSFDLERVLSAVVGLHSIIPSDAFLADTLGTERAGNGVVIDDGLVLTIGYLITEAEAVWLHAGDGRVVQ